MRHIYDTFIDYDNFVYDIGSSPDPKVILTSTLEEVIEAIDVNTIDAIEILSAVIKACYEKDFIVGNRSFGCEDLDKEDA